MAMQQLLKIVYSLDIKFWVRWCTCSMWRMLLPCGKLIGLLLFCLLFLISILFFLKLNIRTLNTWTELARLVMGTIFLVIIIIIMNKSQELTVFHGRQKLTSAKN